MASVRLHPRLEFLFHGPFHSFDVMLHFVQLSQHGLKIFVDRLQRSRCGEEAWSGADEGSHLREANGCDGGLDVCFQGAEEAHAGRNVTQGCSGCVREGHRSVRRCREALGSEMAVFIARTFWVCLLVFLRQRHANSATLTGCFDISC